MPQSYPPDHATDGGATPAHPTVIATLPVRSGRSKTRAVDASPDAAPYRAALRSSGWTVPEPGDLTGAYRTAGDAVEIAQHALRAAAPHVSGAERVRVDSIITLLDITADHISGRLSH